MPKTPHNTIQLGFSVGFGEFQDSVLDSVTGFSCTLVLARCQLSTDLNQHVQGPSDLSEVKD